MAGFSLPHRYSTARSTVAADDASLLNTGSTTALMGPGRIHMAPDKFVGISMYAGFLASKAVLIARSIKRGASWALPTATAQQVIFLAISN